MIVEFRLIVFRPFKHEVMLGRISSATEHGIRVRTQFFDQIFIPSSNLPEGSELYVFWADPNPLITSFIPSFPTLSSLCLICKARLTALLPSNAALLSFPLFFPFTSVLLFFLLPSP